MKKLFAALFALFIFIFAGCSDVSNGNVFEKLVVLQNQNSSSEEKIELGLDFSRTIWPESFSSALNSIDFESLNWDITFKVSSLNTYADARDFSVSNRGFITKNVAFNIDGENRTEPIQTLEVNTVKKGIYDVYVSTVYQGKKIYGTANSVDLSSLKSDAMDLSKNIISIRLFSDLTEGNGSISDFHVRFFEANGWNLGTDNNLDFPSNVTGGNFEYLDAKLVSMEDSNAEEIDLDVNVDYLIAGSTDSNGLEVTDTTLVANLTGSSIPSGYYELVLSWNTYREDGNSSALDLTPISLSKYLVCIDADGITKANDIEAYYSKPETIIQSGSLYYAKMDPACKGTGKYANAPAYFWDLFKFIYKNRAEDSSVKIYCDDFYLDIAKYNEVKASMDPNENKGSIYIQYPKGLCKQMVSVYNDSTGAKAEYFTVSKAVVLRNSSETKQTLKNLVYDSYFGNIAEFYIEDKNIELKMAEHNLTSENAFTPNSANFIFSNVFEYIGNQFVTAYADMETSGFAPNSTIFVSSDGDKFSSSNYCFTQTGSEDVGSETLYYVKVDTQRVVKFKEVDFELSASYTTDSAATYNTGDALPYKNGTLKFTVVSDTLDESKGEPKIESITWKVNGITKQTGKQPTYSVQTSALNKKSSNIVDCIIETSFGKYSSAFEFKFDESGLKPADMTNKKIYLDGKQLKLYQENATDIVLLSGVDGQTRYWIPGDGYIYAYCNGTLGIWQLMEDNTLKQYTVSGDFNDWMADPTNNYIEKGIIDLCYSPAEKDKEDSYLYLIVEYNSTSAIYAVPTLISGADYVEPESVKSDAVFMVDSIYRYLPSQITIAKDYNGYKVILLAAREESHSDNNGFYFWEYQLYADNTSTEYYFDSGDNDALSNKNYKLNSSFSAKKYEVTDLEYVNGKAYALCSEFNIETAPYFNYGSIVEISIGTEAHVYEISYAAHGVPTYESQDSWPTIKAYDNADNPALMPSLLDGNVNPNCFYNPLRFVAIKEDELLIADRVIYQKDSPNKGELEDASRFVTYNLASQKITGTVTGIKLSGIGCAGTWNVK